MTGDTQNLLYSKSWKCDAVLCFFPCHFYVLHAENFESTVLYFIFLYVLGSIVTSSLSHPVTRPLLGFYERISLDLISDGRLGLHFHLRLFSANLSESGLLYAVNG